MQLMAQSAGTKKIAVTQLIGIPASFAKKTPQPICSTKERTSFSTEGTGI